MSMTTEPTPARPSALTRLGRLVAVAVVLLAAWYVARLYVQLARGPAPAEVLPADVDDPAAAALAAIPAGPWVIGDQPWDLRSRGLAAAEVSGWLDRPPAPPADRPAHPLEKALLDLLRARARPQPLAGGRLRYALDGPALRVRGISQRHGAEERLLEARAAFLEGAHWRGMELRAGGGTAAAAAGTGLLPWPEGAARLAVRRDEAGGPVAEMVRVPRPLAELLAGWRAAGWQITGDDTLTCRGPAVQTVQLWAPSSTPAETVLLAIRTNTPTREVRP